VLQCVAVCRGDNESYQASISRCVAVCCCSDNRSFESSTSRCVAMCCSVLQCVAIPTSQSINESVKASTSRCHAPQKHRQNIEQHKQLDPKHVFFTFILSSPAPQTCILITFSPHPPSPIPPLSKPPLCPTWFDYK